MFEPKTIEKYTTLKFIAVSVFVAGMCAYLFNYNTIRPSILILHSYNTDYFWTRDVDVGIDRILGDNNYIVTYRHYMDTKNHPYAEFQKRAGIIARRVIESIEPDVIIAVDDDAQKFVAKNYVNHPKMNIVFAGVNTTPDKYGYDKADNVTGILERNQLAAVRDAVEEMGKKRLSHDQKVRLVNMGDRSATVGENEKWILAFDWEPVELVDSFRAYTFEEWKEKVKVIHNYADFMFTTNYRSMPRSKTEKGFVPPEEVISWTVKNSKIPIIGTHGFFVEEGGPLAVATSPFEQGEVTAKMALEIIRGKKASSIPIRSTEQFIIFMREDIMKLQGIKLPQVYEAFARASNKLF